MSWRQFINTQALREITDGDEAIENEFARMFIDTGTTSLHRLAALIESDAKGEWANIVHSLKGACMNIRAEDMADICRKMEPLGPDPKARRAACDKLRTALAEFEAAFSAR